ncbi:ABC transporter permease [Desulfoferula mesophila]|uniref:Peptide ABC transporter permease n=1 Tax=Desulfoferula mesophila TaxID=3058419 RepID=A0AAU9EWL1_9BACT|nr:peptide ABC transporter permease [Desulfoferula mesophilus]
MSSMLLQKILRRIITIVPVIVLAMTVVFFVSHMVPSDPARLIAGQYASEEQVAQIRAEYGLDKPLPTQYLIYLRDTFTGRFGKSMHTRRPVMEDIEEFFPATMELALVSMFIVIVVGVPLGVVSAVRKDHLSDHASRLFALGGVSVPVFWLAILMQLYFYFKLGWLPVGDRLTYGLAPPTDITGLYILDSLLTGNWQTLGDSIRHIILPAAALSISSMSSVVRQTRSEMLKVLKEDYVVFHKAYGLARWRVIYKYALRNALTPTVSLVGLVFGLLLGGSFLVETVFNWPGIGQYVAQSVLSSDFPAIIGATMVVTLSYALVNLLVDVVYMLINPKVRL